MEKIEELKKAKQAVVYCLKDGVLVDEWQELSQ